MIRQAWLTLPSCFASSSTPTLLRMIFSSLVIVSSPRSDTQCLPSETTPPPSQPVRFDRNGYTLTNTDPPHDATHWTAGTMAAAVGISISSVQRIWRAHQLQPHRFRSFELSRDPAFADKVQDGVGLYVDPPAHAVVLSVTRSRRSSPPGHALSG